MLADTTNPPPDIEELYTSATHTSNLRLDTREGAPRRAADTMVAAGWSRSRLGAALLRVHSEWDGAEKPRKPTEAQIEAIARTLEVEPPSWDLPKFGPVPREPRPNRHAGLVREEVHGRVVYTLPLTTAHRMAWRWYRHELGFLFQKMKTLPAVRAELQLWCEFHGIAEGRTKVAAVLQWWLDPVCSACGGQKWQMIPGTPKLSGNVCEECRGAGEAEVPHGHEGRRMLGYVNDCLQSARASMRGRFKHQQVGKGKT